MAEIPEGTVTILFSDVEGSTELRTKRGDSAAHDILRAHEELFREQIEKHRGTEVKALGDGFMVVFGSSRRAVSCAVDIQRAFARQHQEQPDRAVKVRIGLNTGEVVQENGDLYGEAVNAAARIMGEATGGEILVSDVVKSLAGTVPDVTFTDKGTAELRGFPEPWRLYRIEWKEEAPRLRLLDRTPFVGRQTERDQLRGLLDEAEQGRGSLVLIGGELGVGKTRLMDEVAAEAGSRGMIPLRGHCTEGEGAPPYLPVVEIMESAAKLVAPDVVREALGDAAGEVARIVPEFRRMFPDIPPPLELPAEQERRLLFNCVADFMERAGRRRTLLLIIDDLHWADEPTVLLARHLATRLANTGVVILGGYRDTELDVSRPLAGALEDIVRERLAHRITLKRLSEDGVSAMLRALGGEDPPPSLVRVIYEETEGNPFFVEEVFRHLVEEGHLLDEEGHFRADLDPEDLAVPESIRLVIGRRLERLGDQGRRALAAAGVVGPTFGFQVVKELEVVDEDFLLDVLEEAEQARLIVSLSENREPHFRFAHELIRQTLVEGLSLPRRQQLHLKIADTLERLHTDELEEKAADLAHHLYQAGAAADPDRTCRYLCLASHRALEASAFEEALRYLENALSLDTKDERNRADIFHQLGFAYRSLGRWDDALGAWDQALTAYERAGEKEIVGRLCGDVVFQLGWAARWKEAFEVAGRGLAALEGIDSPNRARLTSAAGFMFGAGGYWEAADEMFAEAIELAERLGDKEALGQSLTSKAIHHWSYAETNATIETGLQAADLLRASGSLWNLGQLLSFVGLALTTAGRWREADEVEEECDAIVSRLGDFAGQLILLRSRAFREILATGSLEAFERFLQRDIELCRAADMPWIAESHVWFGLLEFFRGNWERVPEHIERAVAIDTFPAYDGWHRGPEILYAAYMGKREEALRLVEEKASEFPETGSPATSGAWHYLVNAVEALVVLGERERAGAFYPVIVETLERSGGLFAFNLRLGQTIAGMAAAAAGRWDEAEEHFETALRQADEVPHRIERGDARRFYADMLNQRDGPGDREKARSLLAEATKVFDELGMPKHVEMAEELLRKV